MSSLPGKLSAAVLVLAVIAGAVYWSFSNSPRSPVSHREAATRVLAEYLEQKLHPETVLVVSNPFAETPGRPQEVYDFQEAAVAGLRKGFAEKAAIQVAPAALTPAAKADPASVPVDPASRTPLSFLIEENAFDQLARAHPSAVLVSLIGLPLNLAECQAWQEEGAPAFALLLPDWRMIGDAAAIERAFASGKLAAAVVEQGSAPSEESSSNYREIFDKRFVLVTPDNVKQLLEEQPKLFTP